MFCQRAYQLPKCRLRGDLEHFPAYSRQIQSPLSADSASLPAAKRVSNPSIWHPHGRWYFGPLSRTAKNVFCSFFCCCFYAASCSAILHHIANNALTKNCAASRCVLHKSASQTLQRRSPCALLSGRSQCVDGQLQLHSEP